MSPAAHRNTRLVQSLVELYDRLGLDLRRRAEDDEERLRLRSHRRQVAQVDRRGLVAEVTPRRPLTAKVHPLDEYVLREHAPVAELGAVGVDPLHESLPLELRQEPELTELAELQERRRRPGLNPSRSQ